MASSSGVPLTRFIGSMLDRVDVRDAFRGSRVTLRCEMIIRTALPSGDRNIFMPRWKSGLSNTSGGR